MHIALAVISCMPDVFEDAVRHALDNASGDLDLIALGNGCELPTIDHGRLARATYLRNATNEGIPAALHEIWKCSGTFTADVLAYIHDDFRILEPGWDVRVRQAFEDPSCALVGFGGSTGLGRPGLYKAPYHWSQLCRTDFWSNMVDADFHGHRTTENRPIVYSDGQSLVLRRAFLNEINGWSWWPEDIVHHGYDMGLACMVRRAGKKATLVPVACEHRRDRGSIGAFTRDSDIYRSLAAKHGGDETVFARAHRFVYDNYRDVMPLRLP
jgi:hypothetical protein